MYGETYVSNEVGIVSNESNRALACISIFPASCNRLSLKLSLQLSNNVSACFNEPKYQRHFSSN